MKIVIHRGAHEIGGNCVEIESGESRIVIDLGMPLVDPLDSSKKFELPAHRMNTRELLDQRILPRVKGLYGSRDPGRPNALFISHPHQDHYALVRHVSSSVPIFISKIARTVIEISDIFLPNKAHLRNCVDVEDKKPVFVGNFKVTPYLQDHSAAGATAFLIESGRNSIFYTGDFRSHGRKSSLFEKLLQNPPKDLDCLMMEGTTLGRPEEVTRSESDLQVIVTDLLKKNQCLKLVSVSPQNVDRIVTLFKAARSSRHLFVVDLYTACLLDRLSLFSKIPTVFYRDVRVLFLESQIKKLGKKELQRFRTREIKVQEITKNANRILLMFRESMIKELKAGAVPVHRCILIWSMFSGYLKETRSSGLQAFITSQQITVKHVHASGHASPRDLTRMVKGLKPRILIPIHTFHASSYTKFHHNVMMLEGNQEFTVDILSEKPVS